MPGRNHYLASCAVRRHRAAAVCGHARGRGGTFGASGRAIPGHHRQQAGAYCGRKEARLEPAVHRARPCARTDARRRDGARFRPVVHRQERRCRPDHFRGHQGAGFSRIGCSPPVPRCPRGLRIPAVRDRHRASAPRCGARHRAARRRALHRPPRRGGNAAACPHVAGTGRAEEVPVRSHFQRRLRDVAGRDGAPGRPGIQRRHHRRRHQGLRAVRRHQFAGRPAVDGGPSSHPDCACGAGRQRRRRHRDAGNRPRHGARRGTGFCHRLCQRLAIRHEHTEPAHDGLVRHHRRRRELLQRGCVPGRTHCPGRQYRHGLRRAVFLIRGKLGSPDARSIGDLRRRFRR